MSADVVVPELMRQKVGALQEQMRGMPPYQPETRHYFHAGMYCREVFRHAGALIVGKVHKKEHFYLIAAGTVIITDGEGNACEVVGPYLFASKPGTKRAVYAVTDALCMTFHVTDAATVEAAEEELVEPDADSMFLPGNILKPEALEAPL